MGPRLALAGGLLLALFVLPSIIFLSINDAADPASAKAADVAWQAHRADCLAQPEELYHRDRFRAVKGRVIDSRGKPIAGATVQSINLATLFKRMKADSPITERWSRLIEAESRTDSDGAYEFPNFSVGARTFCFSAHDLAPEVREMIPIQDGVGARLDIELRPGKTLRIHVKDRRAKSVDRFLLIPHRWWPTVLERELGPEDENLVFSDVGGPFQQGLIAIVDKKNEVDHWRILGAYDLNQSAEIELSANREAKPIEIKIPEVECLESWNNAPTVSRRLFFGMLSPFALFWPVREADALSEKPIPAATGTALGFGANAFLPVLLETRNSAFVCWTNDASEFEVSGLSAGCYRFRALSTLGRVTYASALWVTPGRVGGHEPTAGSSIDFDDPDSREIVGVVRWEGKSPAAGASVYVQDAVDFRRFLRRVQTDEQGLFRVSGVRAAAGYTVFAMPSEERDAMKRFDRIVVPLERKESWLEFDLSPHFVSGRLPGNVESSRLILCRRDQGKDAELWAFSADQDGRFVVKNLPHGVYVIRSYRGSTRECVPSLSFEIREGRNDAEVRWPSAAQ